MTVKLVACAAALGLLALPLMARPGNGGRSDDSVQANDGEIYDVNATDAMIDENSMEHFDNLEDAAMNPDSLANVSPACEPGDAECEQAVKDIQQASNDAANAAMAPLDDDAQVTANESGPDRGR